MRSLCRPALGVGGVVFLLLALPGTALAAETASSEIVVIPEGETVAEDLYAAGVRVVVEGRLKGDLIAFAAEEIAISGEVEGSVLAIAPRVTVAGDIGGSLRASSGSLILSGSIGEDLVAAGFTVELDSGSEIGRDALVWAVDMSSAGTVDADLEGSQRTLDLSGRIGGDVDVSVSRLIIGGPLEVIGDLGYRSASEAEGLDRVTVGGVVARKMPVPPNIRIRALGLIARFLVILGLTATSLLVAWGWPRRTTIAGQRAREQILRAFGYGAVVVLSPLLLAGVAAVIAGLAPAAASLPLLAIFGPLIVATAGIVLLLSLVAGTPTVLALGRALPRDLGLFGAILAGSIMVGIMWMLPIVGWIVPLLVLPLGVGAWLLAFREQEAASE